MRLLIGRVYAVSPIESPNAPRATALAWRARPFGSTSTTPCRRARFDFGRALRRRPCERVRARGDAGRWEMTVRCRRCGWSTTGVARDALAAFRSHLCGSVW